jgi:molecular chaperone DnaK
VTPLSLGVETLGGVMTKLIERNTTIPTRKSETFTTAADGQNSVEIHVLQGEREMAAYNKTLGKFHLMNIPPAPRGIPQIEVTFDIDANGIVNVSAKDRGTGQEQKITITGTTALSDEEVDRMVTDAESHADEDRSKKEEAEVRNTADSLVYGTEKTIVDLGDKVPAETKSDVEAAIADVKKALEGDDTDAIRTATAALQEKSYKIAEIVYQQVSDEQAAEGGAEPESDEEVADYEVVDGDE